MDVASPLLFKGFHPEDIFGGKISVDAAELFVVLFTLLICLAILVVFNNWWSR